MSKMLAHRLTCAGGLLIACMAILSSSAGSQTAAKAERLAAIFGGDDPCWIDSTSPCPMNSQQCKDTACTGSPVACPTGTEALSQIQAQYDNPADTPMDPGHTGKTSQTKIYCTKKTTCSGCADVAGVMKCKDGSTTQQDSRTPYKVDMSSATCNTPTS